MNREFREFIETTEFQRRWADLEMSDEDLRALQNYLLEHPDKAPVMEGTGGVRKLRWAREGRGKSGGLRTIYIDMKASGQIYLITVFGKGEKDNLSAAEKKAVKDFVKGL
jgi:hypothetical protein